MKETNFISRKEHRLLLIITFVAFVFVTFTFCYYFIEDYNYLVYYDQQRLQQLANREGGISGSSPRSVIPLFHFLTLFIFLALLKTKRFLLPAILTSFYVFCFIYGLIARFDANRLGGEEFSPYVVFYKKIYYAAEPFDLLAALFISILLFWQISILLRMLIKTTQRKTILP